MSGCLLLQFASDGRCPSRDLADVPHETLVDLDAALTATFAEGSAHLRYRHRFDGEIRQFGVGRIDFEEHIATVGIAGTSQRFADGVVLLRFGQSSP